MKGQSPKTKTYMQAIKQGCSLPSGPRPGATKDFPTSQKPPAAVANPPKSKVGMGGN